MSSYMHSLQAMKVVAKQRAVHEQLYEYQVRQAQAGFAVFDTVTTSIHERLRIFRTHHQKCVARRKNTLGYELRQEDQRTEWLKRKYVDSARQQQQAMPARLDSVTNPRGFEIVVSPHASSLTGARPMACRENGEIDDEPALAL